MLEMLRSATLVAAAVVTGLFAGLFYTFAVSVMIGLQRVDDRTFVSAMQQINVGILNGWFFASFFGAPVLVALAAVLHLNAGDKRALLWLVAGFVLVVATLIITIGINVPLNDALAAAGEPDRIADLAAVRAQFESAWVRWNVARAITSTAALACLSWALVRYRRVSAAA